MHTYHKVILALGSNLGDKKSHLEDAIRHIHNHIGIVTQTSAVYETPAWGFNSFPFYNMCVLVHTTLVAEELLAALQQIERKLGRTVKTSASYEARTVDIDIIYFNNEVLKNPNLQIPHNEMQNRQFVLVPLNDLVFDWKHPVLDKTTQELLMECTDVSEIKKIDHIKLPIEDFAFETIHFLAIEGNIGAGKTTLAEKIAQDFNGKMLLERFVENPFLPKFYNDSKRYAFPLETSFLVDRTAQLKEQLHLYKTKDNLLIADYYIYKSLIFAEVTLDTDEFLLYKAIFDAMTKEVKTPDLYIYLHQSNENLLQNIQKRGRSYEKDIQANYLERITQGYRAFIKTLPKENVLVIDVTNKDFVNNHQDYLYILEKIDEKLRNKAMN
ncbi:2-amino-4-hydroxy-6-hydroxymethyldihydropteridine diphosphokinase [Paenimyroides aestuarii]|uniref:2-amino-4-hydroxy-6-hydroxymethyldihydropteridine pyrophosphokinase n=1 Tax=Paenimyroides aestuarii TaxID=2968490 RepID=A0ABY5NQ83_9FLAO|nr:2-amino-4-hydroxy-6-hydroxymethyldihydropteridine diphosphokinase [Paenimyroides aestuarii]UUV20688.1 2-amino-4-hydroxy-6-hydroxymethyldihydropteridine diphosphokinase [Paenimyroides aestuarii]